MFGCVPKMCRGYARILSRYPYAIILAVLMVVATCLVVTITFGIDIDFDDPLVGFEPRGTEIADRLLTFENLLKQTDSLPYSTEKGEERETSTRAPSSSSPKKKKKLKPESTAPSVGSQRSFLLENNIKKLWKRNANNETEVKKNILCGVPDKFYSRIVVESSEGRSLFNLEDIQAICQLEADYFLKDELFQAHCIKDAADGSCCAAWSIGSYIASLSDKASCFDVTADDVATVRLQVSECASFFRSGSLGLNCDGDGDDWYFNPNFPVSTCASVPRQCQKYNAIAHMLYYLSDSQFMYHSATSPQSTSTERPRDFLRFSAIFLPVVMADTDTTDRPALHIFKQLDKKPRDFKSIRIVGAEFGVKYFLFEEYLISDSVWLGVACGVIFLAMWLYTTSIFITTMAFLSLFWAVSIAYVLYTYVFKIKFFPYMNLVTLVVMVGIGADNLFIYCKVWWLAKSEKNNGVLEKLVATTLHHSVLSMLVTSLTTASAFYANYISDITAIRCFSVFAGTCIVVNFVLTITWLPATIMLQEKWLHCCVGLNNREYHVLYCLCRLPYRLYYLICDWSRIFFEKILPCLVIKFRFLWLIIFSVLWIGSVVVIFFYPRLKLPTSQKFQVFSSDHLLEQYDLQLSQHFPFELQKVDEYSQQYFSVKVVWGVLAKDNGDPLNPNNKGSLTFDSDFDLTSPDAQRWILQFCSHLRHADFYLHTGFSYTDCFLDKFFREFMGQDCANFHARDVECCNKTAFPLPAATLISCLATYIGLLKRTPHVLFNSRSAGPRFIDGKIGAFFVEFTSNHSYSVSFDEVHAFYTKVNSWVSNELLHAPSKMRRGWFVSELNFYDLQSSLASGTPLTLGVSLSIVAVVSFFTTLNVLISIYAFLAVAATISVTLASLVLMNWELNILESVIITIAIGLAIDITLHYGVAYRLAPDIGKEMRVITSLGHMGSPVAMATLTTMLAGALIMPSTVLAYKKFGTFLLLLVSLAWLYATFFFQSLLRIMGPNGGCGQFHWPASDCCAPGSRDHVDKTVYTLSESTLSTSSTSTREHSHAHNCSSHHELEPLTEQGQQKQQGHRCQQQAAHSNNNLPVGPAQRHLEPHLQYQQHHHPHRKGDYLAVKRSCTPPDNVASPGLDSQSPPTRDDNGTIVTPWDTTLVPVS